MTRGGKEKKIKKKIPFVRSIKLRTCQNDEFLVDGSILGRILENFFEYATFERPARGADQGVDQGTDPSRHDCRIAGDALQPVCPTGRVCPIRSGRDLELGSELLRKYSVQVLIEVP